jgi:hypothetical protein
MNNDHDHYHNRFAMEGEEKRQRQGVCLFIGDEMLGIN